MPKINYRRPWKSKVKPPLSKGPATERPIKDITSEYRRTRFKRQWKKEVEKYL